MALLNTDPSQPDPIQNLGPTESGTKSDPASISAALVGLDGLADRVAAILRVAPRAPVLTTSFGLEDQVLTDAAVAAMAATGRSIRFVTLDTGRLFPETHEVWAATERKYGIRVTCISPEAGDLAQLVAEQGIDGFRDSIEARRSCCDTRKVAPLRRALAGSDVWITGLRADQSGAREDTVFAGWDDNFGLLKVSPLADWSRDRAASYARDRQVPLNTLHARGFRSIGCAPCTRAVAADEPERAGRWWWEQEDRKECGLHRRPAHFSAHADSLETTS